MEAVKTSEIEGEFIRFTLLKSRFFDRNKEKLNTRQSKVISKMLGHGKDGFEGGMTAKKYMRITRISKATATRDLQILEQLGIFERFGQGRSVAYRLVLS